MPLVGFDSNISYTRKWFKCTKSWQAQLQWMSLRMGGCVFFFNLFFGWFPVDDHWNPGRSDRQQGAEFIATESPTHLRQPQTPHQLQETEEEARARRVAAQQEKKILGWGGMGGSFGFSWCWEWKTFMKESSDSKWPKIRYYLVISWS